MSIFYYIKHFLVKPEVRLEFLQNKLGPLAKLFDWSGWKGIEPFNIDLDSQSNTILLHPRPIRGKSSKTGGVFIKFNRSLVIRQFF